MRKRSLVAAAVVAVVVVGFAGVAVIGTLMGAVLDGGSDSCTSDPTAAPVAAGPAVGSLTTAQMSNAGTVIAEGRRLGVAPRGILVALAVASQESRFTNYANDGRGGDLLFFQAGIERSLQLPHEAVGTDHGSLGIFQQQWPWWGTMAQLMDPATSARKFYAALVEVPGWQSMPLTVAAQRVQRSAFPDAYADDEALARRLLARGGGTPVSDAGWSSSTSTGCAPAAVATGDVVYPLPRSAGSVDNHNWGSHGSHWARMHTGTDLSVACGTPVLAATDGTVVVRHDQSWAGPSLVQVSTGIGRLTTWYAHLRAVDVADGATVTAGEQIGEVGDLGNATGCHLHFEVHPRGGSIYQDSVDPSSWLEQEAGERRSTVVPVSSSSSDPDWFTVATFNTLGSSHTAAGGNKPWKASGPARTRGVVSMLERYGVDVVGLQELQRPQHRAFLAQAGSSYAVWSPSGDTENAVAWRRSRFRLVSATTLAVPYFDGHPRRMPVVRLRDVTTGVVTSFLNVHNPADTRRYPRQGRWRSVAVARETALVSRLSNAGRPVVVTGDMNDRRDVYCRFTTGGLTGSAHGTSRRGACRVPARAGIDWIFATKAVRFSDYTEERSRLVRWTTDHPFVVARAHAG